MVAGNTDARKTAGTAVVPRAMPVPAPPPGVTDVLRRSARLGLGALGLAGRAAGTVFERLPDDRPGAGGPEPRIVALVPGAVVGLAIEAERRAAAVVDVVASRSATVASAAARPAIVQRALRPLEDRLWQLNEVARREQSRNQAQAAALIPVIVQQVTENVMAQLDFVRLIEQIPVDDIAGAVDVEGIVRRVDLGGIIREATAGVTMETVDAIRTQGITIDEWTARVVDRILMRKQPRDTAFTSKEELA